MATLELGVPLKTREAVVTGPADLPVGRYRVVLVAAGRTDTSVPVEMILNVVRSRILRPPIVEPPIVRPPILRPPIG